MFTLSEIFKQRFSRCLVHHFIHIQSDIFIIFRNSGSPQDFKVKFCGFELSLAEQHELVMNYPSAGRWLKTQRSFKTFYGEHFLG